MSGNRKGSFVSIAVGLTLAAGVATYLYLANKRNQEERGQRSLVHPSTPADHILRVLFEEASEQASSLQSIANGDKLTLYGLYKQSTRGDAPEAAPSPLNVVAYAKHSAWCGFRGMPKQTAQFHYIHAVKELQNGDAISLPSSVEFDLGPSTGMGLKPSQLAFDDEDDTGTSTDSLESRLRKAATSDDIMIMKELVEQGANINAADDHGETALHFCSDRGMLDGVVYLLELGADPNAVDHDGISVLQAAVIAGHAAVCKILLDEGADPDHQDADGDSPRSCADEDHSEKMKQLFANYPAKV